MCDQVTSYSGKEGGAIGLPPEMKKDAEEEVDQVQEGCALCQSSAHSYYMGWKKRGGSIEGCQSGT